GVLGFELRNPYPLYRQKAFIVEGVVPPDRLEALEKIPTWDEWDPDRDRWYFDADEHQEGFFSFGAWGGGHGGGQPL
ncbi:MAG: hypothetical protein AAFY60_04880, partial [Myxococcota bacterium]